MSTTQFLALNVRSGSPQLRRYVDATSSTQGVTFGAACNNTGTVGAAYFLNRSSAINFGGYRTFYAITANVIYKSTDAGGTWSSDRTLTNMGATIQGCHTGLWVLNNGAGLPVLVVAYQNSATVWYVDSLANGVWTTYGPFTFATNTAYPCQDVCVWRNNLVWFTKGLCLTYSPMLSTIVSSTGSWVGTALGALCSYQNTLYALVPGGSNEPTLHNMSIGTWSSLGAVAGSGGAINSSNTWTLFVDGANPASHKLYAITNSNSGVLCYELNFSPGLSPVDISSTVIPPGISGTTTGRVWVLTDFYADVTTPTVYIYFASNGTPGTSWTCYQWNGNASVMTAVGGAGGDAADAIPHANHSQGNYFWTGTNQDKIEIVSKAVTATGILYSFKLYSATGVDVVGVKAWWSANNNIPYTTAAATLSNPSAGILIGDTITGLTADNTTTYTVTWEPLTDGFSVDDYYSFVFEVV